MNVRQLALVFCFFFLLPYINVGYSVGPVVIEFLYYKPPCSSCKAWTVHYEIYEHNTQVADDIEAIYGQGISLERIYFYSEKGQMKTAEYGIGILDWNALVINHERVFLGYVNETYVREIVEAYLTNSVHDVSTVKVTSSDSTVKIGERTNITVTTKNSGIENESFHVRLYCNETLIGTRFAADLRPNHEMSIVLVWDTANQTPGKYVIKAEAGPVANETNLANNVYFCDGIEIRTQSSNLVAMVILAFSFGFFETFSPCLIVLLSFVLSYTVAETSRFKESFLRVVLFGTGFLAATLLLAFALGLLLFSIPMAQHFLTWIVCVLAIVLGLNLLGLLRIPSKMRFQLRPLIKELARKRVVTYTGLFLLGFVFYFLDPCIAPIFVSMMPLLHSETLFFALLVFCLGAAIPFIGIGIFAGSISKLARSAHRHRSKIRATSGLILISYALYLTVFYLIPTIR